MAESRAEFLRRTDPLFEEMLARSDVYVRIVARWLRAHGHDVTVPEQVLRPTEEVRSQYRDRGDLFIDGARYEVKSREFTFRSLAEFPYPTIIVNECHKLDGLADPPRGHYILSVDGSTCIYVPSATKPQWTKVRKYDNQKRRYCYFYEVDPSLVQFRRIPEEYWVGAFVRGDQLIAGGMIFERVRIEDLDAWKRRHGVAPVGSIDGHWPPCVVYQKVPIGVLPQGQKGVSE